MQNITRNILGESIVLAAMTSFAWTCLARFGACPNPEDFQIFLDCARHLARF